MEAIQESTSNAGMRPETSALLMHMYDTHVSMAHLAPYMDAHNSELDLGKVIADPLIAHATVFGMMFTFLLKFPPSSTITARYLKTIEAADATSLDAMLVCIASQVPIAVMVIKSVPYQVLMQEHARILASCTPAMIRQYVCEKLYMRYGLPGYVVEPPDAAFKISQAFARCKDGSHALRTICPHDTSSCRNIHECHAHCVKHMDMDRSHHFTDARNPLPNVDMLTSHLTVFDALMHTVLSDSSLWLLMHGSHALFVPADVQAQVPNYENVCLGILSWIHSKNPQGNIVLIAHPSIVSAMKMRMQGEQALDFNVHHARLMDDSLLQYLPRVCGSFASVGACPPPTCVGASGADKVVWIATTAAATPVAAGAAGAAKEHGWTRVDLPQALCTTTTNDVSVTSPEFIQTYIEQKHRDPQSNAMLYLDFLLKYSCETLHAKPGADDASCQSGENAVVIIDNRCNILNVICAKISLWNLEPCDWQCVVFCPPSCQAYYEHHLGGSVGVRVITAPMPIAPKRFSMPLYNQFLKSEALWESLSAYNRVLMVQDDGLIVRKGLDDRSGPIDWMSVDYVGAVWDKTLAYNDYMKRICPTYVGNGGLSLRNPKAMLRILKEHAQEKNDLHFDGLQEVPEDVFFARYCHEDGYRVPSYEDAKLFSSEQVLTKDSLGFHKCWLYHSREDAADFFESVMRSSGSAEMQEKGPP